MSEGRELKEYEVAVRAFMEADAKYSRMQEHMESGELLVEIQRAAGGDEERMKSQWKLAWDYLRTLLSERNTALKSAQAAMRATVHLAPTQWRGPDGGSSSMTYEGFSVNSVTSRRFDPQSLFQLTREHGLLERLMELEGTNKDGKRYRLVQPTYDIDYEELLKWLKANGLNDVIEGAYDEVEKTPMVKGPKELSFLGDRKA